MLFVPNVQWNKPLSIIDLTEEEPKFSFRFVFFRDFFMSVEDAKLLSTVNQEKTSDLRQLFDQFERRLTEKQRSIDLQRDDFYQAVNQTFQKLCQQLFELRRYSRNDIEQQTLNAQVGRADRRTRSAPAVV